MRDTGLLEIRINFLVRGIENIYIPVSNTTFKKFDKVGNENAVPVEMCILLRLSFVSSR